MNALRQLTQRAARPLSGRGDVLNGDGAYRRSALGLLQRGLAQGISSDSHSDFARVTKPAPGSVKARIEDHLKNSKVVLYMKGTRRAPACGFSMRTVAVLETLRVPYEDFDVLQDEQLRQGIKEYSAWPTIPQLYINGEFIGGSDIVFNMYSSGELMEQLQKAGVHVKDPSQASHN